MHFVKAEKMPRKLKVAFAGSGGERVPRHL